MDVLLVFAILFAIALVGLLIVRSPAYADWTRLAKLYAAQHGAPRNLTSMQSGKVGKLLYNGTLNLAPTPKGIYLSTFPLLRSQAPPLMIPWEAIMQVEKIAEGFYPSYRLTIEPPMMTVVLPRKPLEASIAMLEEKTESPPMPAQPTRSPSHSESPADVLKPLSQTLIDETAAKAKVSSRLRQNYNFHEHSERVQRFLNAMQPGTYVRPHRHRAVEGANRFEFFLVLQGALGFLVMDERGQVLHTECLAADGAVRGIELAQENYHTLVALAPDTVMFELKEGPYDAQTDKEFLSMFPAEGTPEAAQWVKNWESYFSH